MTRDVICYVTNNTPYAYYVLSVDNEHGKPELEPQTIDKNQASTETFYYKKTTGSMHGSIGSVTYTLQDSSTLFLIYNCPYLEEGQGGEGEYNCWFYAGLSNIPASGTAYAIECNVNIDGQAMDAFNPPMGDTITAYITINMNS